VFAPRRVPPPVPNQADVIALDDANYIVWGDATRSESGAIRVAWQGVNQDGRFVVIDWAYQLQAGNPALSPVGP
jgi:hypothetical protein